MRTDPTPDEVADSQALARGALPMPMTLTWQGADVVVRVRGEFDVAAAARLQELAADYVSRGGDLADLVVDLRATTRCRTGALRRIARLVGLGMRLREAPASRPRARGRRSAKVAGS